MTTTLPKYDVFLSFRGLDTRRSFVSFLYKELVRRNIRTFKDDKDLETGGRISAELERAINESRYAVVVISENYAGSPWCLGELLKIMDLVNKGSLKVMPIFYGVDPTHLRWQTGKVAEQFSKHEEREDKEKVVLWRRALTNLASFSGDCSSTCDDDAKLVDEVSDKISKNLMIITRTTSNGNYLVGIDAHMKALNRLLDLNSNKTVRLVGIWARGCNGRSALAKLVYQNTSQHFERHCFLESVKKISQGRHISHLREEFLIKLKGKEHLSKKRLKDQKILLVANDVNNLEQLDTLAEEFNSFGPGSVVIITTQDKQLLVSAGIKLVYEIEVLRFQKVHELFRQLAFKDRCCSAALKAALYQIRELAVEWSGCLRANSGYTKC